MMFKDLIVWQKSIELAKIVYKITAEFPKSETYGLASQMQRSAVSIPSNIAEGHSRNNRKEYLQFLGITFGSCSELETQIIIAKAVYPNIDYSSAESLLLEIQKMIATIIHSLK
ncbi:MAG: four helix bundle protein [Candidatus Doudnabacteria bacterium]|nr:four helix bundle protein [Candidatus Doudnabacteria bacterium]